MEFQLNTQSLVASDPAYMVGSLGIGVLHPCRRGTWRGSSSRSEGFRRVTVQHVGYPDVVPMRAAKSKGISVCVDTGLFGFFDGHGYRNASVVPPEYGPDAWEGVCTRALREPVCLPFGYVVPVEADHDSVADLFYGTDPQGLIVCAELVLYTPGDTE